MTAESTAEIQKKTAADVVPFLEKARLSGFEREKLLRFLQLSLKKLPPFFPIESSKPWYVFWNVHSLSLLGNSIPEDENFKNSCIEYLKMCVCEKTGGYCGSHKLSAHSATTYGAICALVSLGGEKAYESIDRKAIYRFFMSLKMEKGGFSVNCGGESDSRATYTVIAISSILNLLTEELTKGVVEWVKSCQTYEGGLAGEPEDEAHGGYSYCGFATLVILGKPFEIDVDSLARWITNRQMEEEGGFQGRTNKLVDSCYTFWVGATNCLIEKVLSERLLGEQGVSKRARLIDRERVLNYAMACEGRTGGFSDRPNKTGDHYHTCYTLSGISALEEGEDVAGKELKPTNLGKVNLLYNIRKDKLNLAMSYFSRKENVTLQ